MNRTQNPETIIYGGSFNPPTNAHRSIVEACQEYDPSAEVWLMPSGMRHDKRYEINEQHRLNMLNIMIESLPHKDDISICTLEIEDPELTQTHRSVGKLACRYPDKQFRYVFGADAYQSMPSWKHGEILQKELPMLIVPRAGYEIEEAPNIEILDVLVPESSTEVRTQIAEGRSIDRLVCSGILRYITAHRLYSSDKVAAV